MQEQCCSAAGLYVVRSPWPVGNLRPVVDVSALAVKFVYFSGLPWMRSCLLEPSRRGEDPESRSGLPGRRRRFVGGRDADVEGRSESHQLPPEHVPDPLRQVFHFCFLLNPRCMCDSPRSRLLELSPSNRAAVGSSSPLEALPHPQHASLEVHRRPPAHRRIFRGVMPSTSHQRISEVHHRSLCLPGLVELGVHRSLRSPLPSQTISLIPSPSSRS